MHDFGLLRHQLLALLLEVFKRTRLAREGAEVHWNESLNIRQETLSRVGRLARAHAVDVADRENCYVRFVKVIDKLHVRENVSVARMIDREIMVRNCHYKSTGHAADNQSVLRPLADARVLGMHHRDLGIAKVDRATRLHLLHHSHRNLVEQRKVSGDLSRANNLALLLLSRNHHERRRRAVVWLSMRHQGQVAVVRRASLLLFLRAVLVIGPDVDVDDALNTLVIEELNLETTMTEPVHVHFAFHRSVGERLRMHHVHFTLQNCLLGSYRRHTLLLFRFLGGGREVFIVISVQRRSEFIKL